MGRKIFERDVYEHWKTEWAKNGYTPQDVYEIVKAHGLPEEYLGELRAVISEMEGCSPESGDESFQGQCTGFRDGKQREHLSGF